MPFSFAELSENWGEVKEPVKEGVSFYVKYLGSTLVEELDDGQSYGDAISSEAVKTIVNMVSDLHRYSITGSFFRDEIQCLPFITLCQILVIHIQWY